jgi:diguanylate cyclase (GGDEF)-like protein
MGSEFEPVPPEGSEPMGRIVRIVLAAAALALLVSSVHNVIIGHRAIGTVLAIAAIVSMTGFAFARAGLHESAIALLSGILIVTITLVLLISDDGVHNPAILAYAGTILIVSLLLSRPVFAALAIAAIVAASGLVAFEIFGVSTNRMSKFSTWSTFTDTLLILTVTAVLSRLVAEALFASIRTSRHAARHDALTGLPNRRRFQERVQELLREVKAKKSQAAILLVDLDRFKKVNEALGHEAGDRLLTRVAEDLVARAGEDALVTRLGGDEFVILLGPIASPSVAEATAARVIEIFRKPFRIDGRDIVITACVGVSLYPRDGDSSEALFARADAALREAKRRGTDMWIAYEERIGMQSAALMRVETEVREALADGRLFLQYQPIVAAHTRHVAGFEALVRLRSSSGQSLLPSSFIHVAEETGLIIQLGAWVLDRVCRQLAIWREMGVAVPVSVNVSSLQLMAGGFDLILDEAILKHGIAPDMLTLELTESGLMEASNDPSTEFAKLKRHGVQLSIDDFGTGYSSLSYLRRFPVDYLKIDRAFLREVPGHEQSCALFSAIVQLAHSLGLPAIAEGVQSEEQLAYVELAGVNLIQGFAVGMPLPEEEATLLLAGKLPGAAMSM